MLLQIFCPYFSYLATVKLLQSLRLFEVFCLTFIQRPNKCLRSAHVQIWVCKKFYYYFFQFIIPLSACEKPDVESRIHPLKDCMNLETRFEWYKTLYYWALNVTELTPILIHCQNIPQFITLPNSNLFFYFDELYPILIHCRTKPYFITLPNYNLS